MRGWRPEVQEQDTCGPAPRLYPLCPSRPSCSLRTQKRGGKNEETQSKAEEAKQARLIKELKKIMLTLRNYPDYRAKLINEIKFCELLLQEN